MSAPTLVSYTPSGFDGGPEIISDKTVSVPGTQPGDLLIVVGTAEDSTAVSFAGPSASGVTWTARGPAVANTAGHSAAYAYSGAVTGSGDLSVTVTLDSPSNAMWGFGVFLFRNHGGVGSSASTTGTGAPSLALTTTGANSSVVVLSADWNAIDGSSRVWRPGLSESDYFFASGRYTAYVGRASDTLAAGAKTEGLTSPTGQQYAIIAVEVLGSTGASVPVANAGADQTGIAPGATVTLSGSGTNSPTGYQWTQVSGTPVALSSTTLPAPTFAAPYDPDGAVLTFSLVVSNASGSSAADTVTVTVLPQLEWYLSASGSWSPTETVLL